MALDEQVSSEQGITRQQIDDPNIGYVLPLPPLQNAPNATGNFQPLPLKYSQDHLSGGEYGQWTQDISYWTDEGVCVCAVGAGLSQTTSPVNGQTITHEAVRLGKPLTKIVITGTAERSKAWPKFPHWDVQNADIICVSHRVQPGNPHQILNESQIYRVSWEYVYYALKPFTASTYMPAGTSPAETETSAQHFINPGQHMDAAFNTMQWLSL